MYFIFPLLLSECLKFFPELAPWTVWCSGAHPLLFHPRGHLTSETGVQQVDSLGSPFLAWCCTRPLMQMIIVMPYCIKQYHDDGVLAGSK